MAPYPWNSPSGVPLAPRVASVSAYAGRVDDRDGANRRRPVPVQPRLIDRSARRTEGQHHRVLAGPDGEGSRCQPSRYHKDGQNSQPVWLHCSWTIPPQGLATLVSALNELRINSATGLNEGSRPLLTVTRDRRQQIRQHDVVAVLFD